MVTAVLCFQLAKMNFQLAKTLWTEAVFLSALYTAVHLKIQLQTKGPILYCGITYLHKPVSSPEQCRCAPLHTQVLPHPDPGNNNEKVAE